MMICGIVTPTVTPSRPPTPESTTVSIRNCWVMSRRFAPRARRMPISRVRSVTVASMMFMMPMPPTRSEIEAIVPEDDAELPGRALGLQQQLVGDDDVDVLLGVVGLDRGLDDRVRWAGPRSIVPTWRVICESWVSSASIDPARLLMIRSPNRSLQVFSGM